MKLRYAGKSDVGMKRDHNEDNFAIVDAEKLFVVADGMGGHAAGEVASEMAAKTLAEFYQRTRGDDEITWPFRLDPQLSYVQNRLVCAIKLANVHIHSAAKANVAQHGMGTTIVAAVVVGESIHIAHVGDSRAYRVRAGAIQKLTRDHSLLEDMKEANPGMSDEDVQNFPHKNVISRALGMRETVQVDVKEHRLQAGDRYLLCTDGLSGMVDDPTLCAAVAARKPLEATLADLIERANKAGGVDNCTAILIECLP